MSIVHINLGSRSNQDLKSIRYDTNNFSVIVSGANKIYSYQYKPYVSYDSHYNLYSDNIYNRLAGANSDNVSSETSETSKTSEQVSTNSETDLVTEKKDETLQASAKCKTECKDPKLPYCSIKTKACEECTEEGHCVLGIQLCIKNKCQNKISPQCTAF
jgi:hypothetical protein